MYQYKGALTVDVEDSHERDLEALRATEQRAWEVALAAEAERAKLRREKIKLQQAIRDTRKDKAKVRRRLRTVLQANTELREELEKLRPPETSPGLYGPGNERLQAAAAEVARFEARRRQERRAA